LALYKEKMYLQLNSQSYDRNLSQLVQGTTVIWLTSL